MKKLGLISVEMQRSDDGFTLGVPIWLGQSSSKQRKVFGMLLLSQIFIESIPSVPFLNQKHFTPSG